FAGSGARRSQLRTYAFHSRDWLCGSHPRSACTGGQAGAQVVAHVDRQISSSFGLNVDIIFGSCFGLVTWRSLAGAAEGGVLALGEPAKPQFRRKRVLIYESLRTARSHLHDLEILRRPARYFSRHVARGPAEHASTTCRGRRTTLDFPRRAMAASAQVLLPCSRDRL